MKNTLKNIILRIVLVLYVTLSGAQVLDANECITISISNKEDVIVCKKVASFDDYNNQYYYLPTQLRFSRSKSNEMEFSFLAYEGASKSSGAILHFLMSWGLTKNQLNEVQSQLIKIKGEEARLMGAVIPEVVNAESGFAITGKSELVSILNNAIVNVGKTTLMPNAKMAASFQFNHEDSQTVKKALEDNSNELKNTAITLSFLLDFNMAGSCFLKKTEFKITKNFYELLNQIL